MNRKEIRKAGLKVTLPRMEILSLLERSPHLTVDGIYRLLDAAQADVRLPTIYRVLNQLITAGLVTRRQFVRGAAVYELRHRAPHCHMLCVKCGRIDEFTEEQIGSRLQLIAEGAGYDAVEYSLVLYGQCSPGCRSNAVNGTAPQMHPRDGGNAQR